MAAPFIAKMLGGKVAQRFGKQQAGDIISEFIVNETTEKVEEVKEGLGDKLAGTVEGATDFVEEVLEAAPDVVTENGVEVEIPKTIEEPLEEVAEKTENKLVHKGLQTAEQLPSAIKSGINAIPVVGGIGILLGAIIFILFALKPVEGLEDDEGKGVTRLGLIWRVLIGRAEMQDELGEEEEEETPNTAVNSVINAGSYVLQQEAQIGLGLAQASINPFGTLINNQVENMIKSYSNFAGGN